MAGWILNLCAHLLLGFEQHFGMAPGTDHKELKNILYWILLYG